MIRVLGLPLKTAVERLQADGQTIVLVEVRSRKGSRGADAREHLAPPQHAAAAVDDQREVGEVGRVAHAGGMLEAQLPPRAGEKQPRDLHGPDVVVLPVVVNFPPISTLRSNLGLSTLSSSPA